MDYTKPILHRYDLFDDIVTEDVSKEEFLHIFIAMVYVSRKLCPLEVRRNFLWNMFKPKLTAMIISYIPLVNVKLGKDNLSTGDKIEELKQNINMMFERMWEHWTLQLTVETSLDGIGPKELDVEFLTKSMDFLENWVECNIDLTNDKDALWSVQNQIVCSHLPTASWHGNGVLPTQRSLSHTKKGLLLVGKAIVKRIRTVIGWFLCVMLELGTVSILNAWLNGTFICASLVNKWEKMSLLIACWFEKMERNVNFFEDYMELDEKCFGSAMLGVGVTGSIWDALQLFDDMQKWGLFLAVSVFGSFYSNNKHNGTQQDFIVLWSSVHVFITKFPQLQITAKMRHNVVTLLLISAISSLIPKELANVRVVEDAFTSLELMENEYQIDPVDVEPFIASVIFPLHLNEVVEITKGRAKILRVFGIYTASNHLVNHPSSNGQQVLIEHFIDCGVSCAPVFDLSASLLKQAFNLYNRNWKLSNVMRFKGMLA